MMVYLGRQQTLILLCEECMQRVASKSFEGVIISKVKIKIC